MTPETITIVLPLPNKVLQPNCTIGSFGGRMMKAAASKKYRRLAREAIEAEQIETFPWKKVKVSAIFYHANKRKRDQDNAMGALKAAYDGITESKLVADDDYLHMNRGIPDFKFDKEFPRVILTTTRLE
jgi:Holliday junction resolvase RusA-like endonuclease